MQKKITSLFLLVLMSLMTWLVFHLQMPTATDDLHLSESLYSNERAFRHVEKIAQQPHYVGSEAHQKVHDYLVKELQSLGLEVDLQEGTSFGPKNTIAQVKNIIARKKGSSNQPAVVLLTHYDSAPHSCSYGASDDGNGLGIILEVLRSFQARQTPHQSDIIVVFSDAEEIGLLGAYEFASNHPWAQNIGLVLNLEARGTSGPSMMFVETNDGNAELIKHFSNAKVPFTVSNSLMYSVYKMLPNDTDMTAFRDMLGVQGFNFAYIDDHFNYHTVQDDLAHFSKSSMAHQATYINNLLPYVTNMDFTDLQSDNDHVFFSTIFGFIHYDFSLNWIFWGLSLALFVFFSFIGLGQRIISDKDLKKYLMKSIFYIVIVTIVSFISWKGICFIYPDYEDMLHGFTYNGHAYIAGFIFFSFSIGLWIFNRMHLHSQVSAAMFFPLLLWLLISAVLNIYLPGAGFFIIPIFFSILLYGIYVLKGEVNPLVALVFSVPIILIFVPLLVLFPVGLGLKILFAVCLLFALLFMLMHPVFMFVENKKIWSLLFLAIATTFLVVAHVNSKFEEGKGLPTSLVYLANDNNETNYWLTYDSRLNEWTEKYLTKLANPYLEPNSLIPSSKYKNSFTYMKDAPSVALSKTEFIWKQDTVVGDYRKVKLSIEPKRTYGRMDVYLDASTKIHNLRINGVSKHGQDLKVSKHHRRDAHLFTYYATKDEPIDVEFQIKKDQTPDLTAVVSSFDLFNHKELKVEARPSHMIPMPFVVTDAIVNIRSVKLLRSQAPLVTQ